jgi:hypothetical protein
MSGSRAERFATGWLTIPQVCERLGITAEEWDQIRACGVAPLHLAGPDGELWVRVSHFERWLEAPVSLAELNVLFDLADDTATEDVIADLSQWEPDGGWDGAS